MYMLIVIMMYLLFLHHNPGLHYAAVRAKLNVRKHRKLTAVFAST